MPLTDTTVNSHTTVVEHPKETNGKLEYYVNYIHFFS